MNNRHEQKPYYAGTLFRYLTALLGLVLAGTGLYALLGMPVAGLRVAIGLAMILLGSNAVHSAWRAKPSWLSKIGPLP